jgi:hypothetical protein
VWARRRWDSRRQWPLERRGTLPAELRLGRIRNATGWTATREGSSALNAEPHPLGIVSLTAQAAHACALRHGRASGGGRMGRSPAPVPDRHGLDGVSVLQTQPGVKRKARGDAGSVVEMRGGHTAGLGPVTVVVGSDCPRPARLTVSSLRAKPATSFIDFPAPGGTSINRLWSERLHQVQLCQALQGYR